MDSSLCSMKNTPDKAGIFFLKRIVLLNRVFLCYSEKYISIHLD